MDKHLHTDLLRHIANEDSTAFKKLYYLYYDRLFRFAMHVIRNEELSEEIVSDVFFNVWQNRKQLVSIDKFEAYLYKSVKNTALNYIDKENRKFRHEELSVAIEYIPDSGHSEHFMMDEEFKQTLYKAIESLPDKCRTIFKLAREDGFKYKQIAEILGISVRTVDAQMAIANKKLKAIIQNYIDL